jgi:mRNA-degrading endonuclease RelE of RelBE toxin-antitoxin system
VGFNVRLENPCEERKGFCTNCHSHFMAIRPLIRSVVVSKHFIRDFKDEKELNRVINDILNCSHSEFNELHKFEEHINGNLLFRAKKGHLHIVYCINKKERTIVFLRATKHFSRYKRFLENKKQIKKMIESLS